MSVKRKYLILAATIMISALFCLHTACDSGSGSGGSSDDPDIENLPEKCNTLYNTYSLCVDNCVGRGLCLKSCTELLFTDFLDCCEDFEADVECYQGCLDEALTCFEAADQSSTDELRACYRTFSYCTFDCPPPIAQKDSLEE